MNRKKDSFLQKMRHEVMPNAKGYMSNQGENQRASVAREEERGVAADTQIIPPQIRLLDLQEKVFQQERELDRLRGERDRLRKALADMMEGTEIRGNYGNCFKMPSREAFINAYNLLNPKPQTEQHE